MVGSVVLFMHHDFLLLLTVKPNVCFMLDHIIYITRFSYNIQMKIV